MVITGEAGSGKTRFGNKLMSRLQIKHQNLIALILTECSQWNKLDFEKEYTLFIDDLLGKSNANYFVDFIMLFCAITLVKKRSRLNV